jgi:hypothetical protein
MRSPTPVLSIVGCVAKSESGLVIADLSTANPNVIYEFGDYGILKPFTTSMISEDKLGYLFTLAIFSSIL